MFLYVIFEAILGIVAGLLLAICTKKKAGMSYGVFDRICQVTNILLIPVYLLTSPFYMFLGMISEPYSDGFMWFVGAVIALICGSAALFCAVGLGASVALRKRGKRALSFAVQFSGVIGIALTFILYASFVGSLLTPLN